jgi:tRNA dimethylallyltransferase
MPGPGKILTVVGPTASGKTDLAIDLARRMDGEILSADMGQLYRELDAATAKPAPDCPVPYHGIGLLSPAEPSDAGSFARFGDETIAGIRKRGRLPILAGGAGLYIRSLLEGFDALPRRDPEFRERIRKRAEEEGRETLHRELQTLDPVAAKGIPAGNINRVTRALEVHHLTGKPISSFWAREKRPPRYQALYIGIEWPPEALRERIRERAGAMFEALLAEVRSLVPAQYTGLEPGFRCLGYPEAVACVRGELSEPEALEGMVKTTCAYAKRQRTWFRRQTETLWLEPGEDLAERAEAAYREAS